ncbi:hypothetical protein SAMN05661008_00927 [Alkalithermobacter thermoalcaliphilus JW-YL-7 = DSM 7308]|uniref:Uncharacterized protein n=1 Tax=Alkalithermobacter thermoalcaliphilus JW-YL-7 = DSM 7308 TaxID=1121328 RepID=A0A150FQG5_CLOPD|nr:hypothetical protein JWYL7_0927 [[Clostridium] paradoxum JW-YL-7 = DSM 7308]SHK80192.1 hypothetical protein SAMN05661008_00927 [[Clostridium] paradoxum JW-YL-7 = DSM 7308]
MKNFILLLFELLVKLIMRGVIGLNNNKNLRKTDKKTNAELRKMYSEHGSEIGIIHVEKVGQNGRKLTKRSKLSHKKK